PDPLRSAMQPIAIRQFSTRGPPGRIAPMDFLSALAAIVVIDLVLAGDNAIVIALAARNLPRTLQRRAIVWGTVGAVVVRAALTSGVLFLLELPGLRFAGGVLLAWIAYRLLTGDDGTGGREIAPATGFLSGMRTIGVAHRGQGPGHGL